MNINSIKNGNWSDLDTWNIKVPEFNDVVYINHEIIFNDEINNKYIGVFILKDGLLHLYNNIYLNDLVIIGGKIFCFSNSLISSNKIASENYIEENGII